MLKSDGTILAFGNNDYEQCNIADKPKVITDDNSSGKSGGTGSSSTNLNRKKVYDKLIEKALANQKEIIISINNKEDPKVHISLPVLNKVVQAGKTLEIENKNISLLFSKHTLPIEELNELGLDTSIAITAKAVDPAIKDKILAKALKDNGLFQIGSEVFELSCAVVSEKETTQISNFKEPVAVTIDMSDKHLSKEEIKKLTGIRYEKDTKGNIVPVKLGGSYDHNTKTFKFYTDKFSLYGLLKAQNLRKINLTIDDTHADINNIPYSLELAPTIINNRTMVPLRFIAEGLGAKVEWVDQTKTVNLELDNKNLSLVIGEKQPGMDVSPMIKKGRTLVPVRYVSENLGANVLWFPSSERIKIVK